MRFRRTAATSTIPWWRRALGRLPGLRTITTYVFAGEDYPDGVRGPVVVLPPRAS